MTLCGHFSAEMLEMYPNKFLHFDEQRIYIMNTLFDVPRESQLLASHLIVSLYSQVIGLINYYY